MNISNTQTAMVWEVKSFEKYAQGRISTSRYVKKENKSYYSNWLCKFVGKAFSKIDEISEKTVIVLTSAITTQEMYMKDDKKMYPPTTITIFDFELKEATISHASSDEDQESVEDSNEELPF